MKRIALAIVMVMIIAFTATKAEAQWGCPGMGLGQRLGIGQGRILSAWRGVFSRMRSNFRNRQFRPFLNTFERMRTLRAQRLSTLVNHGAAVNAIQSFGSSSSTEVLEIKVTPSTTKVQIVTPDFSMVKPVEPMEPPASFALIEVETAVETKIEMFALVEPVLAVPTATEMLKEMRRNRAKNGFANALVLSSQ